MAIRDEDGIIKQTGGINFTPPASVKLLPKFNYRMNLLQRKYAKIYEVFGGEPNKAPDIIKSDIRLPMLTRIKQAIIRQSEKIYEANIFHYQP